ARRADDAPLHDRRRRLVRPGDRPVQLGHARPGGDGDEVDVMPKARQLPLAGPQDANLAGALNLRLAEPVAVGIQLDPIGSYPTRSEDANGDLNLVKLRCQVARSVFAVDGDLREQTAAHHDAALADAFHRLVGVDLVGTSVAAAHIRPCLADEVTADV